MADYTSTNTGAGIDAAVDNMQLLVGAGLSGVNIDGGSIDNTIIGAVTPAAINGTTGDFSDDLSFSGTNPNIVSNDSDGVISISSNTAGNGAIIKLYGPTHGSKAFDMEYLTNAAIIFDYDDSAGEFTFDTPDVIVAAGDLTISAGDLSITTPATNQGISVLDGTVTTILFNTSDIHGTVGTISAHEFKIFSNSAAAIECDVSQNVAIPAGDLSILAGFLNFGTPSELTISGGIVTATQSSHTLDTEADAASDDLLTINGGTTEDLLFLRAISSSRTIVLKDGTGNLLLAGDFSLDHANDSIVLKFDGSNWIEQSRSNNTA